MDEDVETFRPLFTALHPLPAGGDSGAGEPTGRERLPRGLGVLVRAGASLRRALLVSLVLLLVSMGELAALLLYPGPEVAVVWREEPSLPLVEAP